jgi:hypothetical protein
MKKGGSIPLHPKHGLNPMVEICRLCGNETGSLLLLGNNCKTEAPRVGAMQDSVCDKCADVMKVGIMFVEVRNGESGDNPYRTGNIWGLKEEAAERFIIEPMWTQVKKSRVCFIEQSTANQLGLHDAKPE